MIRVDSTAQTEPEEIIEEVSLDNKSHSEKNIQTEEEETLPNSNIAELKSIVELGRSEIERLGENERYWMAKYDTLFGKKQELLEN